MTTTPTQILDKNGKQTTVHKKGDVVITSPRAKRAPTVKITPGESEYELIDGEVVSVPNSVTDFRGVTTNEYGDRCFVSVGWENKDGSEYLIALTPCCNASGKGWYDDEAEMGLTVCRKCMNEVSDIHGDEVRPGAYTPLAAA